MAEAPWPRVAVFGAGAVGCYFGGMLARAGAPVTLIGRAPLADAVARDGLFLDSLQFQERVAVAATTDVAAARDAEIVLVCVKTIATEDAAKSLAPHLSPDALVASFQNGVDNVERIRAAAGIDAIPVVVYVAAEMAAPGRVKHSGRGDLIPGELPWAERERSERRRGAPQEIAALFARAGVPCRVSEYVEADLWTKMVMNCAYNAISALGRSRYGRIAANSLALAVMHRATDEVLAVARALGVRLPEPDDAVHAAVKTLGEKMENALSSTAQDIARGKRTEIDSLNGYVARRGTELGVPAPVNRTLHALVKLLEESPAPTA